MAQKRGGARAGSGRKKGQSVAKLPVTKEQREDIGELARAYAPMALETLSKIAKSGQSESAMVSAASALLDRGYGKAPQAITANVNATMTVQFATLYEPKPHV